MNSAVAIHLSKQEEAVLQKDIRVRKTPMRLIERSKIILLAAAGLPNIEIAGQMSISAHKVGRWRNRFAEFGCAGIEKELPRGSNHGGKKTADQSRLRSKILQVTTQTKPKEATHWSTRTFLKTVEKQTPKEMELHLIVDNYSTHKHEKVRKWLARNKRVALHFIPTSSSWFNLVERFFGLLTQKQLKRGVFTSVGEHETAIRQFDPSPKKWTHR